MSKEEIIIKQFGFQENTDDKWFLQASIKNYISSGNPSGSLLQAINEAMEAYAAQQTFSLEAENKRLRELIKELWFDLAEARYKQGTDLNKIWEAFKEDHSL